jgi:very-short-patch-repair endonuclease
MPVKPPAPTETTARARRLRVTQTDAERKLWGLLRSGNLDGLKFRRQHPIPPYISDFCCVAQKLIVELDGSQHTVSSDAVRTAYLNRQGWRVLRFWDHDVLTHPEAVADAIWATIAAPNPHPNPSPEGRGA